MVGSLGNATRGYADVSWTKTRGETQHATAWDWASGLGRFATESMHCVDISLGLARLIKFRSRRLRSMCWITWSSTCTRVALKVVHQSLVYFEEIAEISLAAHLTV